MNNPQEQEIRYRLLRILSRGGEITQRHMAREMGISLGKVNFCLAELAGQGFIRIHRFKASGNRNQFAYLLTPSGIEEKGRLAVAFLRRKVEEYEEIKRQIEEISSELHEQGSAFDLRRETGLHERL
ncbi:MAG: MarR family EPS-associated transcriptional regulator [Deltaproteobacteria bacterium]|nr:MarR family EPS-associated transcriptional regulator [Deltaproteobacteria bacterium]